MVTQAVMKLVKDVDEFVGASKHEEDIAQKFFVDNAEGFGEVTKGHKQVHMFLAFFLKLVGCKNHIAPVLPKSIL